MKYLIIALLAIIVFILFHACKNKPGMDTKKIYTDKEILGKILDFTRFSPDSVRFKYKPVLNSIEGKQPSLLPGPKDYVLEAVLHFSPGQIKEIQASAKEIPHTSRDFVLPYASVWFSSEELKQKNFSSAKEYEGDIFFPNGTAKMMINRNTVYLFTLTH